MREEMRDFRMEVRTNADRAAVKQNAMADFGMMLAQKDSSILVINFNHDTKRFHAWSNIAEPKWESFAGAFFQELELAKAERTSGN